MEAELDQGVCVGLCMCRHMLILSSVAVGAAAALSQELELGDRTIYLGA